MDVLPQDIVALGLLVFVFGMKHGFDADHLATIDGLTRFNFRTHPRLARFCGALFSVGHGAVVVTIALLVSTVATRWETPAWLATFGAWMSVAILLALGFMNLHAVLTSEPGKVVQPVGLKGRWLGRLAQTSNPFWIAFIGALFALSFDTVSQAALFALTAASFGGWQNALLMGLVFMAGMLATDGINGLWISRLIRRADEVAVIASRVMNTVVGGMSLIVGLFGLAKLSMPAIDSWSEGKELVFGAVVIAVIAVSFLVSTRVARSGGAVAVGHNG